MQTIGNAGNPGNVIDSAGMGWLDQIKQRLDNYLNTLDLSTDRIIELCTIMGIGFFAGFIFKKYSRLVLAALILFILGTLTLESFNLVSVQWLNVKVLLGIQPHTSVGSLFDSYIVWLKMHLLSVISGFIGFLVGYRVA
ncbi:MAG TPA: hypothetical protein VJJ83_02595 [Candidatus Babeliales bacterium]|nr:hypothetical protein [Candidatus Babeliales bacterium]